MLLRFLKLKKVQALAAALILAGAMAVGVPAPIAKLISEASVEFATSELEEAQEEPVLIEE